MSRPRLSTIIVAHDSLADLRATLPPLIGELDADDELIVVDSGSSDGLQDELELLAPAARLVIASGNVGFAAGANLGAAAAGTDLIVLLNPDASVQPGWAEAIRAPWGGSWAAWMALVTMSGAETINTSGGVLHFTGLGWAGQLGESVAAAPREAKEVAFLSGACLALPRTTWNDAGGLPEHFFMYCEDVDLSLRLRLAGGRLALVPEARVVHDYEFAKGPDKWRLLERNRWAVILRTYPGSLLALLLPALLATELAVWLIALRGGWIRMKAVATLDVMRELPRLIRERRAIQDRRRIDASVFAAVLTDELSSPYLGTAGRRAIIRRALRLYWWLVRFMLRRSVEERL